ncbi:hypothetical protein [Bacillus taeanensis]|uniref:hypothetical protein n=1 Tax=Bacillus taeanensis TaxID=273032 RepID=UPI001FE49CF3|nr:hypothetical protein [Bacillus taeanensis]
MSFPDIEKILSITRLDREDAINLLLVSIAMEEISLSHILNAEAKKIDTAVQKDTVTIRQLLAINRSVEKVLKNVIKKEMILQFKLENILELEADENFS